MSFTQVFLSDEFFLSNDKINTRINASSNAEKIASRVSCDGVDYKNEKFRKSKAFLFKDIYLQTPSKYSVCVPIKSGSKTFRKEIGKLYRAVSDPLKKKFLNVSSELDLKGRNFHASYMIWRSQQKGYGVDAQRSKAKKNLLVTRDPFERLATFWQSRFNKENENVWNSMKLHGEIIHEVLSLDSDCIPRDLSSKIESKMENYSLTLNEFSRFYLIMNYLVEKNDENCPFNNQDLEKTDYRRTFRYFYSSIGSIYEQCRLCDIAYDYQLDLHDLRKGVGSLSNNAEFSWIFSGPKNYTFERPTFTKMLNSNMKKLLNNYFKKDIYVFGYQNI